MKLIRHQFTQRTYSTPSACGFQSTGFKIVLLRDGLAGCIGGGEAHNAYRSTTLTDGYCNFRVFQHRGPPRPPHVDGMQDYLHIGVRVPDLREAAQRCQELGFEIIWEGLDGRTRYDSKRPPAIAFIVEDPDGIVVDVTERDDQWPGVGLRTT